MADSVVPITAGSGTNIDTRTESTNNHHRQVVVLGDPALNAGVAPVDATAGLKVDLGTDNDVAATQSGTWNVRNQDGSGNALTSAARGSERALTVQIVDGTGAQVTSFGGTAGAVSGHHLVAAATANAANVKASAGTLKGFSLFNNSSVPVYLKFHNTAGTPTAGSGVVRTFGIQAGTGREVTIPGGGLSFGTGIGITLVRDLADAGTTATAANDAVGEVFYE
jgi:hypothetical protein